MLRQTLCQFVLKQISKNHINRLPITSFTNVIRKKAPQVTSSQLIYLYAQLHKLNQPQFQSHHKNAHFKQISQFKPNIKTQSYQKQAIISLEEYAIKMKQKQGYQQGTDLCKLFYFRLLNLLEFQLPYLGVLEQFREQFVWRDIKQEVIDYIAIIQKDPSLYSPKFSQTVNLIIEEVSDALHYIDILQLPYLKFVLSNGKKYHSYNISDELLQRIDHLIEQNKYAFTFGQLQKSITSHHKNPSILHYYALLNKQTIYKRLPYLSIDACNQKLLQQKSTQHNEAKKEMGLPGKSFWGDQIDPQLTKIQSLSLYGAYMNIFGNIDQHYKLKSISLAHQYLKYHFQYFSHSGNVNCNKMIITKVLNNTFKKQQNPQDKGVNTKHMELLKLFFVMKMLIRSPVKEEEIKQSHLCLKKNLDILRSIQKPKQEQVSQIFQSSMKCFGIDEDLSEMSCLIEQFTGFVNESSESKLLEMINGEMDRFQPSEKEFVMNEMILFLINAVKRNDLKELSRSGMRLLELIGKGQFKKFSTQAINIQKVISLVKQTQITSSDKKQSLL